MADKYYRLISLIVNICPLPLRELFHFCAKNDPLFTAPYSAHDYVMFRQSDITTARNITPDQYEKIYPRNGQTDISNWDIMLLATTLKLLFLKQISQISHTIFTNIDIIREVRNKIQHTASASSVSDADFSEHWNDLKVAILALANDIKGLTYKEDIRKEIDKAKSSNMPDLGNVLCRWYEEKSLSLENKIQELQTRINEQREKYEKELNDLKRTLQDVSENARSTNTLLYKGSRKNTNYSRKSCKRFKTVDNQQDVMQRKFSETIRHRLPVDPISFSELPDITKKLCEDHFVVVCGTRNSSYLKAALTAIEGMGYAKYRCFELNEASDWWRVTFEEADCIVVVNPFGKMFFDQNKASAMSDVFDSMLSATRDEELHDIVIITEKALLYKCKKYFPHDLLEAEITIIPESESTQGT
ncbi:uncharacterized protein LOC128553022 [Mercenaria mercenaria]|uniref:uncharacterized protein LOC128553022 n=1 Tax=Mercenaria mercenaria TaxID=6596 RepID=UPI00234F4052|nr:uncharacterized protein LOC128553022 [Mercenaria mercenaria]